mgnify:FL=1
MKIGDKVVYTALTPEGDAAEYLADIIHYPRVYEDTKFILDLKVTLPGVDQFEKRTDVKEGLPGETGTWNLLRLKKLLGESE